MALPPHSTPPRAVRRSLAVLAGVSTLGLVVTTATARPAPGGSGGTVTTAMTVQFENLSQPYSWQDPSAFGVDDFMNWSVAGQIAPGESYTYTPRWPISAASEVPAISAALRWSGATTLRMTSVVPMNDEVTAADPSVDHTGQTITAPVVGNTAALCMFFVPNNAVPTFNYAVKITNVGTAAATGVSLTGQESNGYVANFGQFCNRADADGDGWNDTVEEGMTDLTQPAVTTSAERTEVFGVDYLARWAVTGSPRDEVDSYPPDVNDDGTVDQSDVDQISGWIAQGTGLPQARVNYAGVGPNSYQQQSGLWRRYDLNGDGVVTAADVAWVQAEVGRPVPDPVDVIAPWVGFDRSSGTSFARRTSVFLGAEARDNRALTSIRFAVNGTTLTQQCTDPNTEMADPTRYNNPDQPEYQCVWTTPGKAATVTLTISATDAAGNTTTDTVKLNVT